MVPNKKDEGFLFCIEIILLHRCWLSGKYFEQSLFAHFPIPLRAGENKPPAVQTHF